MITITSLTLYPVKSMKGVSLLSSDVDLIGLKGDRRWLVVDANGKFQTIREHGDLAQITADDKDDTLLLKHPTHGNIAVQTPDASADIRDVKIWRSDVKARRACPAASAFLSEAFGRPLDLVYLHDAQARSINPKFAISTDRVSFADGFPVLLTSQTSLEDLQNRTGMHLDIRRFRTNIAITGAQAWAEDHWKRIQIGNVQFRIAKPCSRCIVTTMDPDSGEKTKGNEPLATLSKFHRAADGEIIFGQNLIPETTGHIAVGDAVQILETGPSNLL
jgi:uncharacterized protein